MLELHNEAPSVTGSTSGLIPEQQTPQYSNPLQNIKNLSGRFKAPQRQSFDQNQSYTNNSAIANQPQYEGVDFLPDEEQFQSYG